MNSTIHPNAHTLGIRVRKEKLLTILVSVLFVFAMETASAGPGTFQTAKYKSMDYQVYSPVNIPEGERVPLIVGLHGVGKRTLDISQVLMNIHQVPAGPEFQKNYPCYILAPRTTRSWFPRQISDPGLTPEQVAELPAFWKSEYKETIHQISNPPEGGFGDLEILFELIDKVVMEEAIDPARIYVIGFSMGGTGTWQAIAARPGFFAAAMPAAGGRLFPWQWDREVFSVPIWAFQGSEDRTTVSDRHRLLFEYARKVGGNMKYTEFEGAGHGVNEYAFTPSGEIQFDGRYRTSLSSDACDEEENVWKWLFSKRKSKVK